MTYKHIPEYIHASEDGNDIEQFHWHIWYFHVKVLFWHSYISFEYFTDLSGIKTYPSLSSPLSLALSSKNSFWSYVLGKVRWMNHQRMFSIVTWKYHHFLYPLLICYQVSIKENMYKRKICFFSVWWRLTKRWKIKYATLNGN